MPRSVLPVPLDLRARRPSVAAHEPCPGGGHAPPLRAPHPLLQEARGRVGLAGGVAALELLQLGAGALVVHAARADGAAALPPLQHRGCDRGPAAGAAGIAAPTPPRAYHPAWDAGTCRSTPVVGGIGSYWRCCRPPLTFRASAVAVGARARWRQQSCRGGPRARQGTVCSRPPPPVCLRPAGGPAQTAPTRG